MRLNSVNFIGRLTRDPDFTKHASTSDHDRVWGCIAVPRVGKNKDADFVTFVAWGATARAVAEHCRKGKVLILQGELRTRSTQNEDGTYNNGFEVNCSSVGFGPDAKNGKVSQPSQPMQAAPEMSQEMLQAALASLLSQAQQPAQNQEFTSEDDIPL